MSGGTMLNQGTRVVLLHDVGATAGQPAFKKGMVGMIIKLPEDAKHAYRVQFPDGGVGSFKRSELVSLIHWKEGGMEESRLADYQLEKYVIYRCVMGSKAFGLSGKNSDTDVRGIYLPPAHLHWSLWGVPEQLEDKDVDACYWELEKFIKLALRANPNILECLYTPLVQYKTPIADRLLAIRKIFLSKCAYQTYNGYVLSQFKKMENRRKHTGEVNWKHAMHLIRLLHSGIHLLQHHEILVDVGEHRDQLLAIKQGQHAWKEVDGWRVALGKSFEDAYAATRLPERPDYDRANQFLIEARHAMVEDHSGNTTAERN